MYFQTSSALKFFALQVYLIINSYKSKMRNKDLEIWLKITERKQSVGRHDNDIDMQLFFFLNQWHLFLYKESGRIIVLRKIYNKKKFK